MTLASCAWHDHSTVVDVVDSATCPYTFVVIVVLHRRSACWSFSLKILEAGKARLRSEQTMTFVASCERHVRSETIDVGASIASTNTAIVNFTAKAENAASKRRRTSANLKLSVRTYLRTNNSSWVVSWSIPIAVECQIARAVVAQVFGGLEPRNAQAEGGC